MRRGYSCINYMFLINTFAREICCCKYKRRWSILCVGWGFFLFDFVWEGCDIPYMYKRIIIFFSIGFTTTCCTLNIKEKHFHLKYIYISPVVIYKENTIYSTCWVILENRRPLFFSKCDTSHTVLEKKINYELFFI